MIPFPNWFSDSPFVEMSATEIWPWDILLDPELQDPTDQAVASAGQESRNALQILHLLCHASIKSNFYGFPGSKKKTDHHVDVQFAIP